MRSNQDGNAPGGRSSPEQVDSGYSWWRLFVSLMLSTIGGIGLWSVVVSLPTIQSDFGVLRGAASLPYTMTMLGIALGGILMGRLADRVGIVPPLILGTLAIGGGFILTSVTRSLWEFILVQGLVIGLVGTSATFGPLMADISHWFRRRRGIAVAICASGNYLAGALWPPVLQYGIANYGWRQTNVYIGLFCLATMLPLVLLLRRRSPIEAGPATGMHMSGGGVQALASPAHLQTLLIIAGLSCCIAMSMPQVHIVAYCADLGFGTARGAEMLSIMLGLGVVSRIASGWIADRIGGVKTLLLGSALQCLALILYLPFDGMMSLYIVSALFGLSQGGIVPSYAIIVREKFPASQAGTRVGLVIMSTIVGMALGGWLTGVIYDITGSYQLGFVHGIAWNVLNLAIALWLWKGGGQRQFMQRQPAMA